MKKQMKQQIFDRIAASVISLLILILLEAIFTIGNVFKFENYNWLGYTVQGMLIYLAIWLANKYYDGAQK